MVDADDEVGCLSIDAEGVIVDLVVNLVVGWLSHVRLGAGFELTYLARADLALTNNLLLLLLLI